MYYFRRPRVQVSALQVSLDPGLQSPRFLAPRIVNWHRVANSSTVEGGSCIAIVPVTSSRPPVGCPCHTGRPRVPCFFWSEFFLFSLTDALHRRGEKFINGTRVPNVNRREDARHSVRRCG